MSTCDPIDQNLLMAGGNRALGTKWVRASQKRHSHDNSKGEKVTLGYD